VKYKEHGLCKYCGAKWFFGHRCPHYKSVNIMVSEGEDKPADEQIQEIDQPRETDTCYYTY
jgi:hypothetical protein